MLSIDISSDESSSQLVELDDLDGAEYTIKTVWNKRYQRFYMNIYSSTGESILSGIKLVPGAPITLGRVKDDTPQGMFVMFGRGEITRNCFETGSYKLFYVTRPEIQYFPNIREYLVNSDIQQFLAGYAEYTELPVGDTFSYLDGGTFLFLDNNTFKFLP